MIAFLTECFVLFVMWFIGLLLWFFGLSVIVGVVGFVGYIRERAKLRGLIKGW